MEYVHHVPGRLRVRSSRLKRDTRRADEIKSQLLSLPGIASVDVNPMTGSLTIRFDESTTSSECLLQALRAQGFSTVVNQADLRQVSINPLAERVLKTAGRTASAYLLEKAVEHSVGMLVAALL